MHCLEMGPKIHQHSSLLASGEKSTGMKFVIIVGQQMGPVVIAVEQAIN